MATATSTRSSASDGHRPSIEVKSPVQDVDTSLQPKDSLVAAVSPKARRSGKRSSVAGTSDTSTEVVKPNTADQSIPAATELPLHTKHNGDNQDDESSPTGGRVTDLTVTGAVTRDLAEIAKRDPSLAISGLAALALALAHQMDYGTAETAIPMCAGQLRDTLSQLREMCPPEQKADGIDELANRRAVRRSEAANLSLP